MSGAVGNESLGFTPLNGNIYTLSFSLLNSNVDENLVIGFATSTTPGDSFADAWWNAIRTNRAEGNYAAPYAAGAQGSPLDLGDKLTTNAYQIVLNTANPAAFGQRAYCIKAPVSWTRIDTPHQWVDYYDGVLVPYPFEPNYSPLLAGMANIDLEWNGKPMFTSGIEIEGMNPVSPGKDHQVLISNWHIGSESTNNLYGEMLNGVRDLRQNTWFVNRDPVLLEVSTNGSRALISQLDLTAGGEKSSRLMQTLLTNLGVPFGGASPMPAEKAYAAGGREDQLKRLAAHDARIAPAKRQFYGTPNPIPDFLIGTNVSGTKTAVELPLMGFFGDSVTLGLAGPLTQKLKEVVRMDKPAVLSRSSLAAGEAKAAIGNRKYARVVFTLGESDLDSQISDADFLKNLEALWKTLAASSEKLYWTPIPSAVRLGDAKRADRAKHLNKISEQFFEGKDVYKVPFIYTKVAELPPCYISGQSQTFQPSEAQAIADRLGEAVISFGAQ